MKRKISMGIALMLLMVAMTALPTSTAHTYDDPFMVNLIAGGGHGQQNGNGNDGEDAGDVLVWNDADTLYIKYVTHEPWLITETHLHVALSMGAIPQKNGNPIPGHFENKDEWDPAKTEVTYTYCLASWGWTPGTDLYIAAHAVVVKPGECGYEQETAWGHGFELPGKQWAPYFMYTIQEEQHEWVLFDTFTVPATTCTPTLSNEVLQCGVTYKIEAVGIYFFRDAENPLGYIADAEWAERYDDYGTGWTKGDTDPYSPPYNGLDLCFDGATNTDWGELDTDTHTYSVLYTGTGSQLSLFIKDSYYGDNSLYLTINIYE